MEGPGRLRRVAHSVSLCCITGGPLHRVAAIFALYRPYVDEIVCAVNSRFTDEDLSCLEGLADKVIHCEMGADFLQERYRPWLYAQCESEWILTTDSDEVPGGAFLRSVPDLIAADHVVTYIVPCRWVFPDGEHYLDEFPWEPSWKLALVRNDRATLRLKSGVHEGVVASEPYRYVDLPIYHLDCILRPFEKRREKVAFYDELDGVQLMEDGRPVSEVYYLPERHAVHAPATIPDEDAMNVKGVLLADTRSDRVLEWQGGEPADALAGTVTLEEIDRFDHGQAFPPEAYRAELSLAARARSPRQDASRFTPGERRPVMVAVRNTGGRTWLARGDNDVFLGTRWFRAESTADAADTEGPRSAFNADVRPDEALLQPLLVEAPEQPGEYRLVIDLVKEHVRWFAAGIELAVTVAADA